ncbi:MAG: CoA transferase [Proteobacteria bacterium]|nr:CoA transferase [Pseudomonadota bacterium]
MIALYSVAGQSPERGVAKNLFPRGAFQTKDGYIALNIPDNIMWKRFCEVINREDLVDDERTNTGTARSTNADFLTPIIEGWLSSLRRDEAVETLNAIGVPRGPINTAEDVFADPHVAARGMLMEIDDPEVGTYQFARTTPFLETNVTPRRDAAPALGQHTREIL